MRKDLLLDGGDLSFENGDFMIGPSDEQHIEALITSNLLDWKESPLLSVGAEMHLNGGNPQRLKRDILEVLKSDGYRVRKLDIDSNFVIDLEVS